MLLHVNGAPGAYDQQVIIPTNAHFIGSDRQAGSGAIIISKGERMGSLDFSR